MKTSDFFLQQPSMVTWREALDEADVEFVINLAIAEAHAGHFNELYAIPRQQGGLKHQIACAAVDLPYPMESGNPRNGTGAKLIIIEKLKIRVGFVLLLEHMPGSWAERVELHLMAIQKEYRRSGLGLDTLRCILRDIPAKAIYARCYKKSVGMTRLLEKEGFKVIETSNQGTKTLEYRRNS